MGQVVSCDRDPSESGQDGVQGGRAGQKTSAEHTRADPLLESLHDRRPGRLLLGILLAVLLVWQVPSTSSPSDSRCAVSNRESDCLRPCQVQEMCSLSTGSTTWTAPGTTHGSCLWNAQAVTVDAGTRIQVANETTLGAGGRRRSLAALLSGSEEWR